MRRDDLRHLEHGYLLLLEEWHELVVSKNVALVLRILQIMLLDVLPKILNYL